MARPAVEAASPSTLAPALLRWLAREGADVDLLAERLGLPGWVPQSSASLAWVIRGPTTHANTDDEMTITSRALASLLDAAAEVAAEPNVALRLPRELEYRRYDAVALAARAAATPGDVLSIHARYAPLVFPQLEATLESADESVTLRARIRGHVRGLGAAVDEYLLALWLGRCRRGDTTLRPRSVSMISARPRDLAPLYAAFGTREITFGAEHCALELAASDARASLPGGDPTLVATAEHLASTALGAAPRAGSLRDAVGTKIEATLPAPVSAEAIAGLLRMSARTLQRRLESEGTKLSEIVDEVRERRARKLLADPSLPLAEVAYRAGFADLATFSRAFKRWTGVPPGAYRQQRIATR